MKIYTKTGDTGSTALFGGKRVSKSHLRIESYGTVDELNSWLGLLRNEAVESRAFYTLQTIQERLFTIGAALAADPAKPKLKKPDLREADVALLEKEIDRMEAELPPLTNFILPGGNTHVSHIHITRTVCRRAERLAVALAAKEKIPPLIITYLNRLSDYLFVLARYTGRRMDAEEIPWLPRAAK